MVSFRELRSAAAEPRSGQGTGDAVNPTSAWIGPAGRLAISTLRGHGASVEVPEARRILDGVAGSLVVAQRTLDSAVANATRMGLTVDDNGDVRTPQGARFRPGASGAVPLDDPQTVAAQGIANLIGQVLDAATNIDQWAGQQLNHLVSGTEVGGRSDTFPGARSAPDFVLAHR